MRQYSDDGWSESEWYEREPHKGNRVPLHHYRYHGEHLKNTNMWNDPAGSGEPTSSRNSHNRGVYDHGRQANPNLATDSRGARPSSALPPTKLRYHFTTLQDGLAAVMEASARHVDVEDADSRFLTFRKISDEIEGVSCELKIWSHIGNIDDIVKRDSEVVGEVNRIIVRMNARVVELSELCRIARPSDLKVEPLPDVSSDEYGSHDDAGERIEEDLTESLGFRIESRLKSIRLHLRMLQSLGRSLQDETLSGRDEVIAIESLVDDICEHFEPHEARHQYEVVCPTEGWSMVHRRSWS